MTNRTHTRRAQLATLASTLLLLSASLACTESKKPKPYPSDDSGKKDSPSKGPVELYLPNETPDPNVVDLGAPDSHVTRDVTFGPGAGEIVGAPIGSRCPPDMVFVAGVFCIDRFEVSLVASKTGQPLSPHYPPVHDLSTQIFQEWTRRAPRSRMALGRQTPVPSLSPFELTDVFTPRAQSLRGQVPAGYLSRTTSELACKNAGKRLCSRDEWVRACRGEQGTRFPYGESYQEATCNVHRKNHPARLLHGNSSENHLDPRLNLVSDEDGPLLRPTGEVTSCVSRWGPDGIYDMVGNLDEWIEDPSGTFVGGFFSRGTKEGCEASIDVHDPGYLDYSLGTRCCLDPP